MTARLGLQLADSTRDRQLELIRKQPEHQRAIAAFEERIGSVTTVDQLMEDRELYVFVMKAFDLEDQIFGKAMIRKVLESDKSDPKALVNRLTDSRFRELYDNMGFGGGGTFNTKTLQASWRTEMVERYVGQRFESAQAEQNETVGTVLEFRRKAGDIRSWFDVLKDAEMGEFMRTALGLPKEMVRLDVDKQVELFKSKFDLAKLKDPAELERLERRYVAISDVKAGADASANLALQLMNVAGAGGRFTPVTLDITMITSIRKGY
ncbi:DUF1217 domain-containing protein [Limimaricola pyoseonensis]|nr:DUF1217 domain-containing protein [Limimaricola pyoseonensis]